MQHTDCKAKMVVKLIADKWHVIYFALDHNHDLVIKPSLKKFLRSHKGIPKQEKDFIALLHGCNLSTGQIMQVMNEFYGSTQLVPYEAKDVGNFRSTIRRMEKYKDIQETLDHFKALKNEDSEFFYKLKLDIEHRVECLFWKVLETNQVRRVTCKCCPCGVEDVSPLYIGAESESDLVEAQGTGNKE